MISKRQSVAERMMYIYSLFAVYGVDVKITLLVFCWRRVGGGGGEGAWCHKEYTIYGSTHFSHLKSIYRICTSHYTLQEFF
jgi:hypothetical protein